ncbi:MAG: hypothetical protein JO236_01110 [Mycobacterium sp.]|uniref:alpha/beta hydrolase n=1 Tax=Mycobacterium sp. TaxID=1785 RepID=UPI001EB891F3|nr:alpha/beta hydrolase [Mycobacterium sp.]MBW0016139.1 hypothetical protein [Mycobacterium sp.]
MTLTLADIDTWDAAAIDQVFAAATARAEGAETAGNTVGDLLSFLPWEGRAADAARDSAHLAKITLVDHGELCRRVAEAAQRASAEIADLKYRLAQVRADADQAFITIDSRTGALTRKTAVLTVSQMRHQQSVTAELPGRIAQLLDDADAADHDLAAAIEIADGTAPGGPSGAPTRTPPMPPSPPGSAPPADVKRWWDALTPQQQVDCIRLQPGALDRDGIPTDIRDAANRIRLPREIAAAKASLDTATHDEAVYWQYVHTRGEPPPGTHADPVAALANASTRYNDLLAIQTTLYPKNPDGSPRSVPRKDRRTLILLDTQSNSPHVLSAIGIGDVDRATHVGVTTGGVATNADSLAAMTDEATNLRETTVSILGRAGDPDPNSVATIAWVGYEPPAHMGDLRVLGDGLARSAAPHLSSFFTGLAVTSESHHQEITAFGHSYGSLVTSLALQQGAPVRNVVFYGSPGLELGQVSDLHLAPGGQAYYEQAPGDAIGWVQRLPVVLDAIPFLGPPLNWVFGSGDHDQWFGDTPNEMPGITQLSTTGGADPMRLSEHRTGASGHAEYARDDGTGDHTTLRMSGYNLAAVLSGVEGAPKTGG